MPARSRRAWRVEHVRWRRCGRAEKGLPRSGNRRSCADRGPDEPSRRRLDGRLARRARPDPDRRRCAHRARTARLRAHTLARGLPRLLHAGHARRAVLRMDAQRLRNVDDEGMPATFAYQRDLARQAERTGWDVTLIAELNLNDIKGPEADCLEAWTTAAALAPCTERLELMAAVRPNFRIPALVAKEAATIDHIANGRFTLNVVSAWWEEEAREYGATWVAHDERYARTAEFL